jgi:hypothetical protein
MMAVRFVFSTFSMTSMCLSPPYLILCKIFKTYDLGSDLDRKVLILLGAVLQILPNMGFSCGLRRKMAVGFCVAPCLYYMGGVKGLVALEQVAQGGKDSHRSHDEAPIVCRSCINLKSDSATPMRLKVSEILSERGIGKPTILSV